MRYSKACSALFAAGRQRLFEINMTMVTAASNSDYSCFFRSTAEFCQFCVNVCQGTLPQNLFLSACACECVNVLVICELQFSHFNHSTSAFHAGLFYQVLTPCNVICFLYITSRLEVKERENFLWVSHFFWCWKWKNRVNRKRLDPKLAAKPHDQRSDCKVRLSFSIFGHKLN